MIASRMTAISAHSLTFLNLRIAGGVAAEGSTEGTTAAEGTAAAAEGAYRGRMRRRAQRRIFPLPGDDGATRSLMVPLLPLLLPPPP